MRRIDKWELTEIVLLLLGLFGFFAGIVCGLFNAPTLATACVIVFALGCLGALYVGFFK